MARNDDILIDTLVDMGIVEREQIDAGREAADSSGEGVLDTLITQGLLAPSTVAQAKAAHYGMEYVDLNDLRLSDEVISKLPRHLAKKFNTVPVMWQDETLAVALSDPTDIDTLDNLRASTGLNIEPRVAAAQDIEAAMERYYGGGSGGKPGRKGGNDSVSKMIQDITEGDVEIASLGTLGASDGSTVEADAPMIKLVNQIIVDAFKNRASDIHLEPMAAKFRVRYRIDGVLHEMKGPPKKLQPNIVARLKIQSGMSIAERRIPQDGRIQTSISGKLIDLRVNVLPTNHGESVCMRILDKEGLRLGLPELGFFTDDQQTFERLVGMPDGILLVTGPTGSGKTTTLYSVLNYINRPDRKIITVEDPVEYMLSGINQVQVHEHIGFTFASALRAMLRQAPNVVMLGEIRDMETASIAINASLTGHLVFSTLHTNDAPSAVTRLIDIGVKPFLVASSTRGIMAQRLVRKVCKVCTAPAMPSDAELRALSIDPNNVKDANFRKGKGCPNCSGTGNRGRFGVFEIFVIEDEARKLIYDKVPATVLRNRAREMGMRTLREDGARKVIAGLTTADEVIRNTVGDTE